MNQIEPTKIFLTLILTCVFLISCASQKEPLTNAPQNFDKTNVDTTDNVLVENSVPSTSDNLNDTTAVDKVGLEKAETEYSLNWKIDDGEVVAFKTAMNPVEDTESSISFDFDQLFTGNDIPIEARQQLSDIKLPRVFSMISILESNSHENISVKMIVDEIDLPENELDNEISEGFNELMGKMKGTVQLRGELTPDGAISSFYLEQEQRNVIAMFFELPTEPINIGDSWEIDVNCISMGNGFIATNAERVNHVEFSELIENSDGESIAVLDYFIAETVEGDFQMPLSDEAVPTTMTCTFLGQGFFLIEEGRWEQFAGEFAIKSTGIMNSEVAQHFALTPLEDIPEEYIGLK